MNFIFYYPLYFFKLQEKCDKLILPVLDWVKDFDSKTNLGMEEAMKAEKLDDKIRKKFVRLVMSKTVEEFQSK